MNLTRLLGKRLINWRQRKRAEPPNELLPRETQFILDHTSFDKEQILEWHNEFKKECPNGKMNMRKFISICQQTDAYSNELKLFSKYAFKSFDKDRSNYLDFIEFLMAVSSLSSGDLISNIRLTFQIYDLNGNGKITKAELKRIIEALYKLKGVSHLRKEDRPRARVKLILEKYDLNRDQEISENEFITACLEDPVIRSLLVTHSEIK